MWPEPNGNMYFRWGQCRRGARTGNPKFGRLTRQQPQTSAVRGMSQTNYFHAPVLGPWPNMESCGTFTMARDVDSTQ